MKYLPDIPAWPQLPPRSPKENMGIQFSEGFPGIVVNGDKVHIEPGADFETELTQVYFDAEQGNFDKYAVSLEYAAGFHAFLSQTPKLDMVKGQITGPITWGLMVTDKEGLAILYNENLAEATAKFLRLKASWQENALRQISRHTIVFVDEPYLLSLRSVFTSIPEDKVTILLEEVFQGIRGLKGLHCCGNTDWPVLLGTSTDILSMDAYNYASSFSCYPGEVNSFLERGGAIAWGIVPNNEEALSTETVSSLYDRLGEAIAPFTKNGISFKQILRQSLLTPSCGLASLSPEAARQALELVANLSHNLRKKYSV
jgi:methionine synthase II (cobalamin-independent)